MDNYQNKILTEVCELLLEYDMPVEHVRNLAADLPGEYEHLVEAKAEAAWDDREPPDDSAYRRQMIDAGRGHLLR
jgi:hypothetical protein